jgi:hypothetical protein
MKAKQCLPKKLTQTIFCLVSWSQIFLSVASGADGVFVEVANVVGTAAGDAFGDGLLRMQEPPCTGPSIIDIPLGLPPQFLVGGGAGPADRGIGAGLG